MSSDLRQDDERHYYAIAQKRRFLLPYCERRVEIQSSVDRHGARFVITDEGPGFDTKTLLSPIDDEEVLKVGGRGMLLIRAFMDEVQHNDLGNRITLIKRHFPGPVTGSRPLAEESCPSGTRYGEPHEVRETK
jgi:Histidine kinase-like ATPase domain